MPCRGVEPKPQRHGTELSRGKKSAIWMVSVSTPTFVNMASFLCVTLHSTLRSDSMQKFSRKTLLICLWSNRESNPIFQNTQQKGTVYHYI